MMPAGAAGGAVLGSMVPSDDSDERLGKTVAGGLAGGAAGMALANPLALLKNYGVYRNAGMLSGGALVKHGLTGAGAALSDAVEGGRGLSAAKEMLRLPTNIKNFGQAYARGEVGPYGLANDPAIWGPLKTVGSVPNKVIGAAIDSQHKALARAGVPEEQINKYLLTNNRSLFGGMKLSPEAQALTHAAVPFQRVPAKLFGEGWEQLKDLGQ
jgi:hypothetical protein